MIDSTRILNDSSTVDINRELIRIRLGTLGADGKFVSPLEGGETDAELREMTIQFTEKCPAGEHHSHCPFRVLSGVSYAALTNLVASMNHESLIELFEMERECRNHHSSEAA